MVPTPPEALAQLLKLHSRQVLATLVRALSKLKEEQIPYQAPQRERWPHRLQAVFVIVYLVFNEGSCATHGDALMRVDLCEEAIRLARLINRLIPEQAEVLGLLALLLLQHARASQRTDAQGDLVCLEAQERTRLNKTSIREGVTTLDVAIALKAPGSYQVQAAIAALHAESDTPEAIDPKPFAYNHRLDAAKADLSRRASQIQEAIKWYERALKKVTNAAERRFLEKQRDALNSKSRPTEP